MLGPHPPKEKKIKFLYMLFISVVQNIGRNYYEPTFSNQITYNTSMECNFSLYTSFPLPFFVGQFG